MVQSTLSDQAYRCGAFANASLRQLECYKRLRHPDHRTLAAESSRPFRYPRPNKSQALALTLIHERYQDESNLCTQSEHAQPKIFPSFIELCLDTEFWTNGCRSDGATSGYRLDRMRGAPAQAIVFLTYPTLLKDLRIVLLTELDQNHALFVTDSR